MKRIEQLIQDLQGIAALPKEAYASAKVETKTEILDADALKTFLAQCHHVNGWVQSPSKIHELIQADIPSTVVILDGEWQQAEQHYSLTHLGLGQWQLTTTQLQDCKAQDCKADEVNCVVETVYQNRVGKGKGQLVYKKLWQFVGSDQTPSVTQAVFAGFKGE